MAEEHWVTEGDRLRAERARLHKIRTANVLITLIRLVCGLAAAVLVAYILLTLSGANPDNDVMQFVADLADVLSFGLQDLFTPADPSVRVTVNYGLAAVLWLVIGAVLTRILRRLSSPYLIS